MKQPVLASSKVTFLFIDERDDRIRYLENEISLLSIPENFHIDIRVNEFDDTLTKILDALENRGAHLAPTFAFIDPFGFKGAPFRLVKKLMINSRTEVFINIMVDSVNRFVEHPLAADRQHIKDLMGASDKEIETVINSQDRVLAFRQLYQSKLLECAKFVRYFEMCDERNKVIYYLFFASNHPLGHKKMKEAFWKVDSQSGFKFSDRTNPNQPVLFELDPSIDLAKILKAQFSGTVQKSEDVISFVEDKTPYIETHAKKALCHLENGNDISIEPIKTDGTKRRKGKFPPGVVIHF
ncbi:MAG: three-Cys-motif partner protein TcmP [Chloroflexota bacterium]|jgi:three-Cys-motif partner protein